MRSVLYTSAFVFAATPVLADDPPNAGLSMNLDVVARQLDIARQQIQPSLGATTYNFSPEALQDIPQGDNAPLNQVLLQAPGVAQDSFGQIHLRGEHANVQYRLNGVELPEGLSVFGQALESRFARSMSLITGALPAQYGFQTAGVVDIQTKTGTHQSGLRGFDVRRQLGLAAAQLRVWRAQRSGGLVRHRSMACTTSAASKIRPPATPRFTTPPTSSTAWRTRPASSIPTHGSA